jgi:hypothetical protein
MTPLPVSNLRSNIATWAVPLCRIPAVAGVMGYWPNEAFDKAFRGQCLQTTYFDTSSGLLRKARLRGNRYLTLRLRRYAPSRGAGGAYPDGVYAVSAKTEDVKQRFEIAHSTASQLLTSDIGLRTPDIFANILSPELLARLLEIIGDDALVPVVTVCASRYAVEDDTQRLTLDVDVRTDTGKVMPYSVLEFKSTDKCDDIPEIITSLMLRPIHMSKYLWATSER